MEKILESENGVSVVGILGIAAIVLVNTLAKTVKAAIENDYDVSVKVHEHGEASVKPSDKKKKKKKNDEQKNEEQEAEEQNSEEVTN